MSSSSSANTGKRGGGENGNKATANQPGETFNLSYFESQKRLFCGAHSINNLLQAKRVVYLPDVPCQWVLNMGYVVTSINAAYPLHRDEIGNAQRSVADLKKQYRAVIKPPKNKSSAEVEKHKQNMALLRANIKAAETIYNDLKDTHGQAAGDSDGNVSVPVVQRTLEHLGYRHDYIAVTKDTSAKATIAKNHSDRDLIGYIVPHHATVGAHYMAFRREQDNYVFIDSVEKISKNKTLFTMEHMVDWITTNCHNAEAGSSGAVIAVFSSPDSSRGGGPALCTTATATETDNRVVDLTGGSHRPGIIHNHASARQRYVGHTSERQNRTPVRQRRAPAASTPRRRWQATQMHTPGLPSGRRATKPRTPGPPSGRRATKPRTPGPPSGRRATKRRTPGLPRHRRRS